MEDTPEYDWDTRYDGIQGFSSHLKNRVSETSTPQGGQSTRGRPRSPPEPQRQFKQLRVYDEMHSGRPLPTLQQIRQGTYERFSRKKVRIHPVTFAGIHTMIIEIVVKKPIVNPKMLDKVLFRKGGWEDIAQIVTSHTQECVLVHGVNNLAI